MADMEPSAPPTEEVETSEAPEAAPAAAAAAEKKKEGGCCGCGAPGSSFFEPLQKNPLFNSIKDTLMWRNMLKSGIAFAALNTIFLLVLKGGYSFLTLTCYALLVVEAACFAYAYGTIAYGKFVLKSADVANPLAGKTIQIPRESVVAAAELVGDFVSALLTMLVDAFCFKCVCLSTSTAFGLLFLAWLGKRVRITTLSYVVGLVLFFWPRLYHEKHELIDKYAGMAHDAIAVQVQRVWAIVKEKLPAQIGPIKIKTA